LVPAIGYFLVVTNAGTLLRPQAFTYNQLDLSYLILAS
jgi:translation initiation factor 6 (eIF-6)